MAITRTPIIDDDGSGQTGTVIDNAWKQEFYDQIDAAQQAGANPWVNIPYAAANFSVIAGTGTWTVPSIDVHSYVLLSAKTALIKLYVFSSTVSGSPTILGIALPGMPLAAVNCLGLTGYFGTGNNGVGSFEMHAGTNTVRLSRDLFGTPFAAGTLGFYGDLTVQLP